ncbi:hypothetical protein V1478_009791 [Vespula squamosa]|uniref:Uncharacterized protein n=1 Tax=Vespula squamosa TaxID=30214 RepID=A0ABD2ALL0_VESSQ
MVLVNAKPTRMYKKSQKSHRFRTLTGNKIAESYGGHRHETKIKPFEKAPIVFPKHEHTCAACQIYEKFIVKQGVAVKNDNLDFAITVNWTTASAKSLPQSAITSSQVGHVGIVRNRIEKSVSLRTIFKSSKKCDRPTCPATDFNFLIVFSRKKGLISSEFRISLEDPDPLISLVTPFGNCANGTSNRRRLMQIPQGSSITSNTSLPNKIEWNSISSVLSTNSIYPPLQASSNDEMNGLTFRSLLDCHGDHPLYS